MTTLPSGHVTVGGSVLLAEKGQPIHAAAAMVFGSVIDQSWLIGVVASTLAHQCLTADWHVPGTLVLLDAEGREVTR